MTHPKVCYEIDVQPGEPVVYIGQAMLEKRKTLTERVSELERRVTALERKDMKENKPGNGIGADGELSVRCAGSH